MPKRFTTFKKRRTSALIKRVLFLVAVPDISIFYEFKQPLEYSGTELLSRL
jgi:hypothetical protein